MITLSEITEMRDAQAVLRESVPLRRLAVVGRGTYDAARMQDLEGRILAWNPGAERMYGWSEVEALKMNIRRESCTSSTCRNSQEKNFRFFPRDLLRIRISMHPQP
jgi:PAS domain-containing protein